MEVPPEMLMCRAHWWMVPTGLRAEVWRTYRAGQEITKDPSAEYLRAMRDAIEAVAKREAEIAQLPKCAACGKAFAYNARPAELNGKFYHKAHRPPEGPDHYP